ncbi:hypothetical protein EON65_53930 [archaeon]|nr:MAG: hypothetical protein EON65_53930 [archaeon]
MSVTISSSKKGVLYRQSKNSGLWQRRYCSITGSFLTLYKSSEYSSQSLVAMVDLAQVEDVFISDRANPSFPHTPTPLPESPNSLNTNHYIVLQMKSKNLLKSDQMITPKDKVGGVSCPLTVAMPLPSDENAHPQAAPMNGM